MIWKTEKMQVLYFTIGASPLAVRQNSLNGPKAGRGLRLYKPNLVRDTALPQTYSWFYKRTLFASLLVYFLTYLSTSSRIGPFRFQAGVVGGDQPWL